MELVAFLVAGMLADIVWRAIRGHYDARRLPEIDVTAVGQPVLRIGDEQLTLVDSSQDWTRGMLWLSLQNVEQFERASIRPRPTPKEA